MSYSKREVNRHKYIISAYIDFETFVEQAKGSTKREENAEQLVCKLKKSLYGRNWNSTLDNFLLKERFKQSNVNPCVYFSFDGKNASR